MGTLMSNLNVNDFGLWLSAAANLAADLPLPIQIAWAAVLGWTVLQLVWLVRVRAAFAVPPMVEAPKPRPRPMKKKAEPAPAPATGGGDLLQDLGVQVHASSGSMDSAYR